MLNDFDYKDVLDTLSFPVLVAFPIRDENDSSKIVDFYIEYVNQAFTTFFKGVVKQDTNYTSFKDFISPEVSWIEMAKEGMQHQIPQSKSFYSPISQCWLKVVMSRVANGHLAVSFTDISKDKENEQQLKRQNMRLASLTDELSVSRTSLRNKLNSIQTLNSQLLFAAYHDTMTNLNNRACFTKTMDEVIADAKKNGGQFGLILLDIDNLREINESRGHHAGDSVIRQCASILRKFETEDIVPYRFGGDEFIVISKHIPTRDSVFELGEDILAVFNHNSIGISAGIAIFPDDSDSSEDLLKFADMAKSEVKKDGKNNVVFFHQVMQEKFLAKMTIETKLSKAMADKVFQLYFQPQFDVGSGVLRGFEALLRWHDEELGWISPEQFIPLAEETNLVVPIGDWVMETALSTLSSWEEDYDFKGQVSVNVSPAQLKQPDFLDKLTEKINRIGIDVAHLELEITEGMLIDNVEETVKKLNKIRDLGIGLSLDDFGTGYSSLHYLQILPLTTLKIDKSFISNISDKEGIEANIIESIVSLVSKMGLDTIAEGVETPAQLDMLKKFNCHNVQGFLKGKPMPRNLCERVLGGDSSAILSIENGR